MILKVDALQLRSRTQGHYAQYLIYGILLLLPFSLYSQTDASHLLPNGWSLKPAGHSLPLGDLPLNIAVSKSNHWMAVTNNGQSVQSIQLIDVAKEKIVDNIVVAKSWYGLKFSDDEKYLFASGGNDNWIYKYAIEADHLIIRDTIKLGKPMLDTISPAGLDIDEKNQRLYVVTKENNSLYVVNLNTKIVEKQLALGAEAYTCVLSPDKKELYISLWGGNKIIIYSTQTKSILTTIPVGSNPNELLLSKNGRFLFVANGNDNSVSVINIKKRKVLEALNSALYPNAPTGCASNGLALSADEKTIYIANADNNALAVFDVSKIGSSKSKGFIPVGWYPTNVKVVNGKIWVTNGKGFSSFPNPNGPNPESKEQYVAREKNDWEALHKVEYVGGLMKGTMSIIAEPNAEHLALYSQQVYDNTPYKKEQELNAHGEPGNPIPMHVGDPSPIKYVFYIVKENRTYDQVLGDLPQGHGDTSLVLFGSKVTPNQHKLATDFVLLDNFYADGEVSADGHNWSLSANANDYLEKNWPTLYGDRGGTYDSEGNRAIANPKDGFLWDYCKRANVTYRTYGEFVDNNKANIPVLEGHFCPFYTSWDLTVRDTVRFGQWKKDFETLWHNKQLPQLNTLRFVTDHTEGMDKGRPTVFAHVADNDLAVGLFVEYLSKSPIWDQCAIFIVEDDAQNGCDHIDAHRTTAYVAGGYVKRKFVDHTMYSTSSMLRTIELILGLPPMSQYDAAAEPMWRCFSSTVSNIPFSSLPANIDLTEVNAGSTSSNWHSPKLDFSKEDLNPDGLFSEVIWKAVKGEDSVMPAPKRSAFLMTKREPED